MRFNFDIGHAHLAEGPGGGAHVEKALNRSSDLIVSAHIHDNHGEKDEHLPPYDGSIDWPSIGDTAQVGPLRKICL